MLKEFKPCAKSIIAIKPFFTNNLFLEKSGIKRGSSFLSIVNTGLGGYNVFNDFNNLLLKRNIPEGEGFYRICKLVFKYDALSAEKMGIVPSITNITNITNITETTNILVNNYYRSNLVSEKSTSYLTKGTNSDNGLLSISKKKLSMN